MNDTAETHCMPVRVLGRVAVCMLMLTLASARAAEVVDSAIETLEIHPNLYVIAGAGANITLQTGDDGTVLVDAGSLRDASRVLTLIKGITAQPIRYIMDSSADADHVGGSGVLARAGRSIFFTGGEPVGRPGGDSGTLSASILAPVSVLQRVSAPTGQASPFP